MRNNNWYNHIQSQKDNFNPIDRYLRDTAMDAALIKSYGLTTSYGSSSGYNAISSSSAAQKACTALDGIKSAHIRNLNNKLLGSLRDVLSDDDILRVQNKDISIMSPSVLGNNPIMKKIKQDAPELIAEYDKIVSDISNPIDAKKQAILQLIKTDYGSAQHVEAQQKLFEQQFRVSEYFEYLSNYCQAPICKPIISELAQNMREALHDLVEEDQPLNPIPISHDANSSPATSEEIKNLVSSLQDNIPDDMSDPSFKSKIDEMLEKLSIRSNYTSSNAQANNEANAELKAELEALKNAFDEYKESNDEEKQELKKQIEWIASLIDQHGEKIEELEKTFDYESQALNNYYKGFTQAFNSTFASAQAVTAGQLKMEGSKSVAVKIAAQIFKCIPAIGEGMASGLQGYADYKATVETTRKCKNFMDFVKKPSQLEKWSKVIANELISNESMSEYIANYEIPTEDGAIAMLKQFVKDTKEQVDGQLTSIDTLQAAAHEFLGNEHAKQMLETYICSGKFREIDGQGIDRLKKIAKQFIIEQFPDEANDNSQNQNTSANTVVVQPTQKVEESKEGELTSKKDQADTTNMTLEQKFKEALARIAELEKENEELKKNPAESSEYFSKAEVEAIMQENKEEFEKITEEINGIVQENTEKDGIIDELTQESAAKDVVIAERDYTIESQGQTIQNERNKNEDLTNKLKTADDSNKEYKDTIKDLREHKNDLREKVKDLKDKASQLTNTVQEKESEIATLQQKITELEELNQSSHTDTYIVNILEHNTDANALDTVEVNLGGLDSGLNS